MTCAALLAMFFHGMTIEQLDRERTYEVPASIMQSMSMTPTWLGPYLRLEAQD